MAPIKGSATDSGTRVAVSGVYADAVCTVLFAELSQGPGCGWAWGGGGPYLVDQFHTRYRSIGGIGIDVGPYPIFFEPLLHPAAKVGAQLTLHVPIGTPGGRPVLEIPISAPLAHVPARALPLPPAITGSAEDVTYELMELRHSNAYLQVHTRLTGQLQRVIVHYPDGGRLWPGVHVVTPSDGYLIPLARRRGLSRPDDRVQDESRIFALSRPGDYQIVVEKADEQDHNARPASPGREILASWPVTIT